MATCEYKTMSMTGGAGTNLKVGSTGPERKWGAPIRREAPETIFLVVPLHLLALKAQLVVFGKRFCDGQYSLVSFLFAVLLLTVPPCSAIFNSGGTCPPCPMESAPLSMTAPLGCGLGCTPALSVTTAPMMNLTLPLQFHVISLRENLSQFAAICQCFIA